MIRNFTKRQSLRFFYNLKTAQDSDDKLPFDGWNNEKVHIPYIEELTDAQLIELNKMLDWKCFVVDSKGRRFGNRQSAKKRSGPQEYPDYRLKILNDKLPLDKKHVLEVGCFEGIHTSGLCSKAYKVTAIDSRISNVVKTIVRTKYFGFHPEIFVFDLEKINSNNVEKLFCDVVHHIGVLYHLVNPVEQIMLFEKYVQDAVFLDTHYSTPEMVNSEYNTPWGTFKYYHFYEHGYQSAFAGMLDHAKWLLLEDIESLLIRAGFSNIEIIEKRDERNGPRVLLLARKK